MDDEEPPPPPRAKPWSPCRASARSGPLKRSKGARRTRLPPESGDLATSRVFRHAH
jgi:hypothetical protein